MVECAKEYVLQWTGHAAHVTERFSGLLARQALVDVTLICQGQKLRVHKLVLASSSLYFEEMLEQDLGQEPVILLRDLDFEVLKAMVEFMYCGETTISQRHLQTLLDAAQVFKVKELKCIVESMMKTKITTEQVSPDSEDSSTIVATPEIERNNYKARSMVESFDEKITSSEHEDTKILENKSDDRVIENNSRMNYIDDENSLYEISEKNGQQLSCQNAEEENLERVCLDTSDSETSKMSTSEDYDDDEEKDEEKNDDDNDDEEGEKGEEESTENDKISSFNEDNPLKSFYNETRCCKFIDETELRDNAFNENSMENHDITRAVGECSRVYTHKKRKFIDSDEFIEETSNLSSVEISNLDENFPNDSKKIPRDEKIMPKDVKVYTHKRRKSTDDKISHIFDNICDSRDEPNGTTSIDLSDDTSLTELPINLTNCLDMETSEYIWNLSTENIQYVVGCTINSANSSIIKNERKKNLCESQNNDFMRDNVDSCDAKRSQMMKQLFSRENEDREISEAPILRRSVRINQLESEDSFNNNNNGTTTTTTNVSKVHEKSLDRERNDYPCNVRINLTKARRRVNRDSNFQTIDENIADNSSSLRKNVNSRSLRSRTKLSSRKSDITRSVVTSRDERGKNLRQCREKMEKCDTTDILVNKRLNTIASVDRALWGDMSDFLENNDVERDEFLNYTKSREIPFAVGLLPLRAALERMQATIDHQPRKTRSSVAPWRQETIGMRRKFFFNDNDSSIITKKQINLSNDNVDRAICHIEIRTSSSPDDIDKRRINSEEQSIAVGNNDESNEQ